MRINCLYNKGKSYCFAITILVVMFMCTAVSAQNTTAVSGIVIDDQGIALEGVYIAEKGTSNNVITDLEGKFTINVAGPKSELVFTYIGFETVTQVVGSKTKFNIALKSSASEMDEVIVIGYGSAKKSDLTGAISTISGDDLKKVPLSSVAETLTGRLAGVQVSSGEGSPDADISIKIRGGSSLTQDSAPLIIVDGFPVNSMSDISPADIDKLTVLKDASSTAIYGSRGANGVIIITTKSGTKDNKLSVTYNTFFGAKFLVNKIDVLSPSDYANWQYEYALLNDDLSSYESVFGTYQDIGKYNDMQPTNWQKEIYGNMGLTQSHDLNLRGGSEKMNYSFTYSRYDESAIMVGSDFKRNNLTLNLKNKPSDKVNISFTTRYAETEINGGGANDKTEISSTDSRLKHVVGYAPIPLPGLTTDNTDEAVSGYLTNPYVAVADNDRLQKRKNLNMLGSFSWDIFKNFQFKTDFGLDNYYYTDNRFYGRSTYYVGNIPLAENQDHPAVVMNDRRDTRFRNANTINYDFKDLFGEDHSLTALLGEEMINYQTTTVTSTIHGFDNAFSFEDTMNLSSLGKPQSVNNFVNPEDKLLSFFGRVNYDYKNRYLLTGTFRADGSSKFLGDNRWGYFPAAAAAWKISSEEFLKSATWINLLKIRLSYGESGNNNIPTGQTAQTYQAANSAWINGTESYLAPTKIMANPDLKWETTVTQNLGLDFEFFKGRVNGSFELYKNNTQDLLLNFLTAGAPYESQYKNVGEIENKGVELTLNLIAVDTKDYGLNFSFNYSANKNKIVSLGGPDFGMRTNWASTAIDTDYAVNVGQPMGQMFGYVSDGRYEVSDFTYDGSTYTLKPEVASAEGIVGDVSPGTMKLKDINGDGVVNLEDRRVIGNALPKSTGGFVINANAYGFDLMAAFNWSYGNDIYNANKIEFTTSTPTTQYRNLTTEMAQGNRWTNVDPGTGELVTDPTALTALNANTNMWSPNMGRYVFSDWAVEDGSFLRLNTLTLGYTLPKNAIESIGLSRFRLYATCSNVFVLTNYSGPDPEVSTRRSTPLTPGVDYSAYPRSRQFVFGLNLNF
jgi:TonB-linked SusC/RagA family outer membrane protein